MTVGALATCLLLSTVGAASASASPADGNPVGRVDVVRRVPGGVVIGGWALDPDTPQSIAVHLYRNGVYFGVIADRARPDVAGAFPGWGPNHGFVVTIPALSGHNTICAYGINIARGHNSPLGCFGVTVAHDPVGVLDLGQGTDAATMSVAGWAFDPDTSGPVAIHIYVDGIASVFVVAQEPRPDVGAAHPGYGDAHGFRAPVPSRRDQQVCVYAVNAAGPGRSVLLGCRIDPTTGRPPSANAPVPPYSWSIQTVSPADLADSWRPGCPVGPGQLRRVNLTYWDFTGARRQGSIVVHQSWAPYVAGVFQRLYQVRFQMRVVEPITEWSGPGDDRADRENRTSGFICRPVTGGSGWSHHSYGWAIDVNPVQNPYVNGGVVVPDPEGRDYLARGQVAPAMIRSGDAVVNAFASIGWVWGGNWSSLRDYMHFSATGR